MLAGAVATASGSATVALGWLGVDQVSTTGPDYQGIALLIGAISGLIATLVAAYIALRRPHDDPVREWAMEELRERADTRHRRAEDHP